MTPSPEPTVYLVDDDAAVRDALAFLLGTVGLQVRVFPDGSALQGGLDGGNVGCLLLDIRMPHVSGLQLQEQLRTQGVDLPIIIMTGHGNVDLCRRAFQQGAVDFLEKPIDETALLEAVQRAIRQHLWQRERAESSAEARSRLARLTEREREVLAGVMDGQTSKQSAKVLGISARTVETHRASLFEKLEVHSLAELMRVYLNVVEGQGGSDP
ncbi:response regulator transcription factor [Deinococcus hopiensis]|uniref:Two component transcriptional regulator, LuxR family n=1 Tax=Deinococcus hopiensis KR-140 TaxID=695939 RepID=A0A1W1VV06_9DEIO|nr:response regulator [Deinococcus hopiensis]SMB97189.1 two component transcriptional regulator, LuxR family [Deinococcus hopiensis KR-140]